MDIINRTVAAEAENAEAFQAEGMNLTRRRLLQGAGGLVLGFTLGPALAANAPVTSASSAPPAPLLAGGFQPNAFLRIGTDGVVTVISKHLEMGPGTYTGLSTLIADELDADWSKVTVTGAPAGAENYKNLLMGLQDTGGGNAMANAHEQMRRAGATARAMLVLAAAQQWSVPAEELMVSKGVLAHAKSGRKAGFGALTEAAAKLPVPKDVKLKDPKDFTLIGKLNMPCRDSYAKTNGTAVFTQDFKLLGMLVAVVAHSPGFGGAVKSFDASKAKAVPGVVDVVQVPSVNGYSLAGVAVLAEEHLSRAPGPRRARRRMGRLQGLQDGLRADLRAVPRGGRQTRPHRQQDRRRRRGLRHGC
ncbi:MAG: molybdopterin-dependent oxidoreductase [Candidatus Protistobacter heckmanni]|nr:molybdopterin-dependent oxidoreductase [Candidatus Protistobacter heckmanni]